MQFYLSESESIANDCRIARNVFSSEAFDLLSALDFIARNKVDVCKIRLPASDSKTLSEIQYSGLCTGLYSINYSDSWPIDKAKGKYVLPGNVEIIQILRTDEHIDFIDKILSTRGWFNYINPVFNDVLKNTEQSAAKEYFSCFLNGALGVYAWLLKVEGLPVGIFMASSHEDELNGSLYGILPEFRSMGLAKYIFMHIHNFCLENRLLRFNIDVGISNIASQQAALSSGMKVKEVVINIYLYPLLSKTLHQGVKKNINEFEKEMSAIALWHKYKIKYQCLYKNAEAATFCFLSRDRLHQAVFEDAGGEIVKTIMILT